MEDGWCDLLNLKAVPHLLDPSTNTILDIEAMLSTIPKENLPVKLANELASLDQSISRADKVQYYTITHKASDINADTDHFAQLELMPQPYVFFDVSQDQVKESSIDYAIYPSNSKLSQSSFRPIDGSIKINPSKINESKVSVSINTKEEKLHSNSKFLISTQLPVQVFYTLMLVYYNKKVARVLVTRNIVLFHEESQIAQRFKNIASVEWYDEKNRECAGLWIDLKNTIKRNQMEFDTDCFRRLAIELCNKDNLHWKNRMFYYVYKLSGKPQGDPNFGEKQFNGMVENSLLEPPSYWALNWNSEFLNKCFDKVLREIFDMALEF